jgi:hypothetical protein
MASFRRERKRKEMQQQAEPSGEPQIDMRTCSPHERTKAADEHAETEDLGQIAKVEPG